MKNACFRENRDFSWILTLLLSFMKVWEFYQQLLCGFCKPGPNPNTNSAMSAILRQAETSTFWWKASMFEEYSLVSCSVNFCNSFRELSVWNLIHFKNSTVKSRIFSRALGWSLVMINNTAQYLQQILRGHPQAFLSMHSVTIAGA